MIWEMLAAIGMGFVAHQTILITARMPIGWRNITEHIIGVTAAYPSFLLFKRRLTNGNGASAAYWLGYIFFGMGVAVGWLVDTLSDGKELKIRKEV